MKMMAKRLWRMTCMEALMLRRHGCVGATLDELEAML